MSEPAFVSALAANPHRAVRSTVGTVAPTMPLRDAPKPPSAPGAGRHLAGLLPLLAVAGCARSRSRRRGVAVGRRGAAASCQGKKGAEVTMVLDFMCPWSFIGLRSLLMAKREFADRLDVNTHIIPFEFDPPGTYPPEGMPLVEYYERRYGKGMGKQLFEERTERVRSIGMGVGINFRFDRRLYHTVEVNTALVLAQEHGHGEAFAEQTLERHFQHCEDPNDLEQLRLRLANFGIAEREIEAALADPQRAARNDERTANARHLLRDGGVPSFSARRAGGGGEDLCASVYGSATSPAYFASIFARCLA